MRKQKVILCFLLITMTLGYRMHQQSNPTATYDSIKSKYDTSSDYKYYDNLNSPQANYYYGSVTRESYEMSIKLSQLDGYKQCVSMTPYAKKDSGSCMSCPSDKPLFNLGARQCEACRPNMSSKCDAMFNYTTPAINDTQQSNATNQTVKPSTKPTTQPTIKPTTQPTTPTKTPTTTPYVIEWQPKPQNESTIPKVDNNNDFIFEPVPLTPNDTNLHQNYTVDYRVVRNDTNQSTSNETLIAQSQSKENATFADKQCPAVTPYYNPTTKTCQNCKENEQYVLVQKKCLPIIFASNPKTKYIILMEPDQLLKANLNISKTYPERTVQFCDISKPLAVNNTCTACSGDKIFNFTSQECQDGCPEGKVFSETNSQCIEAIFLTNSDAPNLLSPIRDFQEFRSSQKLKIKSSPIIVECPLSKPVSINKKCSTCPNDYPYFNIESQKCETCQRNRNYNEYTRRCETPTDSGMEVKKIVPNIF